MVCFNYFLEDLLSKFLKTKDDILIIIKNILFEQKESNTKSLILLSNFQNEIKEIEKILEIENAKVLNMLLNKTLKNLQNLTDLDTYLKTFNFIKETLKNIKNEHFDYKSSFKKHFFEFISPFLEQKEQIIKESLENEKWAVIQENTPNNVQKQINILFYKNFVDFKNLLNSKITKKILTLELSDDIEEMNKKNNESEIFIDSDIKNEEFSQINKNDDESTHKKKVFNLNNLNSENIQNKDLILHQQSIIVKNYIEIENSKYKIMNSTITLINSIFETYKILLICEDSLMPHLSDSICTQLTKFLEINNEMVLNGEGVRKGKLKAIYQKEISMVCSNAYIVKRIVKLFSTNQLLYPIFGDLSILIENILRSCRLKISDLFQQM